MTLAPPGEPGSGGTAVRAEPAARFVGNYAQSVNSPQPAATRPPRRALLQVRRVDPASLARQAMVWSAVGFLTWMVAVTIVYAVLSGVGALAAVSSLLEQVTGTPGHGGTALVSLVTVWRWTALAGGVAALSCVVVVCLVVAIYNACARLVGGLDITLSEQ